MLATVCRAPAAVYLSSEPALSAGRTPNGAVDVAVPAMPLGRVLVARADPTHAQAMTGALRALLPGSVVLLLAVVLLVQAPEPMVARIASTYGLVVYGAGLALAWVFHRSRAFVVLGVLAWLDMAILSETDRVSLLLALGTVVVGLIGGLAVMRDRGIASRVGTAQIFGACAVAALSGVVFADDGRAAAFAARSPLLPWGMDVWPGYPGMTLGVAALALLGVAYGFHRYRGAIERSFVWAIILLLVAMHPQISAHGSELFLMATGLTVTLGVVETSYVLAYRDDLTGLPGRRALMQYLDGLQGTYTIAMVDIDHFKQFNDKHGHDVGDQVLKLVASRLGRTKGGGKAYRYGGEEFTLLFPGRVTEDARPHLEEVRRSVEDSRFSLRSWRRPLAKPEGVPKTKRRARPRTLSVTVSIGIADSTDGASDAEAILKRADEALYRAKRGGRNRLAG
jgi:GGDEF domain-containing protein